MIHFGAYWSNLGGPWRPLGTSLRPSWPARGALDKSDARLELKINPQGAALDLLGSPYGLLTVTLGALGVQLRQLSLALAC